MRNENPASYCTMPRSCFESGSEQKRSRTGEWGREMQNFNMEVNYEYNL